MTLTLPMFAHQLMMEMRRFVKAHEKEYQGQHLSFEEWLEIYLTRRGK